MPLRCTRGWKNSCCCLCTKRLASVWPLNVALKEQNKLLTPLHIEHHCEADVDLLDTTQAPPMRCELMTYIQDYRQSSALRDPPAESQSSQQQTTNKMSASSSRLPGLPRHWQAPAAEPGRCLGGRPSPKLLGTWAPAPAELGVWPIERPTLRNQVLDASKCWSEVHPPPPARMHNGFLGLLVVSVKLAQLCCAAVCVGSKSHAQLISFKIAEPTDK